jgi:hypothetical protein
VTGGNLSFRCPLGSKADIRTNLLIIGLPLLMNLMHQALQGLYDLYQMLRRTSDRMQNLAEKRYAPGECHDR